MSEKSKLLEVIQLKLNKCKEEIQLLKNNVKENVKKQIAANSERDYVFQAAERAAKRADEVIAAKDKEYKGLMNEVKQLLHPSRFSSDEVKSILENGVDPKTQLKFPVISGAGRVQKG